MSEESPSGIGRFFSGEAFERLTAILIALVTLLATLVGFLEVDARTRSDRASRDAQRFAVQAMGRQISGATQIAYAWSGAYQSWDELDTLAISAEQVGDAAAAARYRTLRDQVAGLSPLLGAPYFDSQAQLRPDVAGYESDLYLVEATVMSERYAAAAELDDAWSDKADAYVANLTLLAVTLFLFGLSTTIAAATRWLFMGTGLFITAITFFWMLLVLIRPVPQLPGQAISGYARAIGAAHRGDLEGALATYDQVLAEAPDYAIAHFERGNAHFDLGNYEAAAADYEAAQAAGRDDINVAWNLGWTYYLRGRFEDAIRIDRHGLEMDPEQIGVRFNLGLALLAGGQFEAAQTEYANALATAQRQVTATRAQGLEPPSSLWWSMDAGALDLESLANRLDGQEFDWTQAPSPDTIAEPGPVQSAALGLAKQIRDMTVALEFSGQPPAGLVTAQISPFEFGQSLYDDDGNFLDYEIGQSFPNGTDEVLILYEYDGLSDGQQVIWKVYWNGVEDPSYRLVETWSLGSSGSAEKALTYAYSNIYHFSSGHYVVEMYVDSHQVQRGSFTIEEP